MDNSLSLTHIVFLSLSLFLFIGFVHKKGGKIPKKKRRKKVSQKLSKHGCSNNILKLGPFVCCNQTRTPFKGWLDPNLIFLFYKLFIQVIFSNLLSLFIVKKSGPFINNISILQTNRVNFKKINKLYIVSHFGSYITQSIIIVKTWIDFILRVSSTSTIFDITLIWWLFVWHY
jgi:hypothetical protein